MDAKSYTDICILLVDPDTSSSRNTLTLLLDANYRVVTASQGTDALNTLQKKKRKVDLVLMPTKLPDMCAFEVLDILQIKFGLPVVMVCDTYHGPTMLRFLQNGAMYCLVKPLRPENVKTLWQHSILMERELMQASYESPLSAVADKESEIHEAKEVEELDKVEGSSMGLSFTWTSSLEANMIRIVRDLGIDYATPLEVIHHLNVPGLTIDSVIEKLQELEVYPERELMQASCESPLSAVADKESEIHEAKEVKELDKVEGSSMGLTLSFTWTSSLEANLIRIVRDLGVDYATPYEVIRRLNVPGLTIDSVIEKLQELEVYPESQELHVNMQLMDQSISPGLASAQEQGSPVRK